MKRPIDFRPPDLVTAILGLVFDDDDPAHTIPEAELLELLDTGAWKTDTIRRTIRELVDFGALRRVAPTVGDKTTRFRVSTLGRAWINQEVEAYVRKVEADDLDDQADEDPTLDVD
jgi:hypothetical protein